MKEKLTPPFTNIKNEGGNGTRHIRWHFDMVFSISVLGGGVWNILIIYKKCPILSDWLSCLKNACSNVLYIENKGWHMFVSWYYLQFHLYRLLSRHIKHVLLPTKTHCVDTRCNFCAIKSKGWKIVSFKLDKWYW